MTGFRYLNSVVNSERLLDEACDSDGEVIGQESCIFAVLEFISVLGESRSFQSLLPPIFPHLLYLLIIYMQITHEQVYRTVLEVDQLFVTTPTSTGESLDGVCQPVC